MSGSVIKSVLYFLVCTSTSISIIYGYLYCCVDGVYVVMISVIFSLHLGPIGCLTAR